MSSTANQLLSRRRHSRQTFMRPADWDFYTEGSGAKPGFIENISAGGLLLCTSERIDHRRWVRILVRAQSQNLWFTLVGRVIRRENRMESWQDEKITLYRHGIELVQPAHQLTFGETLMQPTEIPVNPGHVA